MQFVDNGDETAPSFSVTVNDGDADSNTLAASVTYTPANDTPVLDTATLSVTENQTVTLSGANFGITDPDEIEGYERTFRAMVNSFRPIEPAEVERIRESRLRVARPLSGESLSALLDRAGADWSAEISPSTDAPS